MKRNQSAFLGVLLAAAALIVVASGCSSSNPVAPDTSSDIVFENPQATPYWPNGDDPTEYRIDGDRVADIEDIMADQGLSKPSPSIPEYIEGTTTVIGERVTIENIELHSVID